MLFTVATPLASVDAAVFAIVFVVQAFRGSVVVGAPGYVQTAAPPRLAGILSAEEGKGRALMPSRFRPPDSRLLKILFGFCAAGFGTKVGLLLFQKQDTLSDKLGNFFIDLILPYVYGAFGSDLPFVWLGASMSGAVFAFAVHSRGSRAATIAKRALVVLFLLSLFTIWIEQFASVSAAVSGTLMTIAKIPMKFADIGVSLAWAIVLWRAMSEIDAKVAGCDDPPTGQPRGHSILDADDPSHGLTTTAVGVTDGVIEIRRPWKMNQALYGVTVLVDGRPTGKLRNGKSMTFRLPAGVHRLTVRYFLFTATLDVQLGPGDDIVIEQTFGSFIASPKLRRV